MKQKLFYSCLLIFFLFNFLPLSARAVTEYETASPDFDEDLIVADHHFTDTKAMTLEQIQAFLESRGKLGNYIDPATHLPAAFIIHNAAKDYGISPKILLVLLQKEQSLVEDPAPVQKQYDWATGYSCYNGTCDDEYKGFSRQVKGAARRFMIGYWPDLVETGCTFTNWCVGQSRLSQDNVWITPKNKATAALYTYNPYRGNSVMNGMKIGANYNFWKIWNRWFPETGYPDGTLLKAEADPKVYLIRNGQKRWISSYATLVTRYNPDYIISVSAEELAGYTEGDPIKFPLYALLKTPNGAIYLIADDTKRMIVSWEVFRTIGFNPEEVEDISFKDLAGIPSGKALTLNDAYPTGALLKNQDSLELYYVESGFKYPVVDKAITDNRYPNLSLTTITATELEQYETGETIKFKDGLLIRSESDPTVYVVSNGQRRAIDSEIIFNSFGYKWSNVLVVSETALNIHPLGDPLTIPLN